MKLIYIHGASATGDSFNYIRSHLKYSNDLIVEYDSADGFEHNLDKMKCQLKDESEMFFICHSLGGIYALHLADTFKDQTLGAVTISTPYGGAESADYAKYFLPFSRLLRDIGPSSKPMRSANDIKIQHPWTNIVTTRGDSPWIVQSNDGVVTLNSMTHRKDMKFVELNSNHYEVVISPNTVDIIKKCIKGIKK